jgi:predicted small lipoprotein YifL
MRALFRLLAALVTVALVAGCNQKPQEIAPAAKNGSHPRLDPKQEAMLSKVKELLQESGHWRPEYPLESVTFDEKRGQWQFLFGDNRPDSGIAAYISDETAERIDILLFPPLWTKYERKKSSNQAVQRTGASRSTQKTNRTSSAAGSRR